MLAKLRNATRTKVTSRKTRGQALVEFALVLPMLLLLLTASIEFGWMMFNYVSLYNGLREGIRYASVGGYTDPPQFYQCNAIRDQIISRAILSGVRRTDITIQYDIGDPNYTVNPPKGSCPVDSTGNVALENGYRVNIYIDVTVPFLTPFMKTFATGGIVIKLTAPPTPFPTGVLWPYVNRPCFDTLKRHHS